MNIAVCQLLARHILCLELATIFGIPGVHILPIYHSLYDSGIYNILLKHAQGEAFKASGYVCASVKTGAEGICNQRCGNGREI